YLLHVRYLLDRIEIVAHVMDAAPRGRYDVIETAEVADEQCLGIGALGVEPAIGHRLPAAGLVARVYDLMAEALQKLEGRDANFRKEGIDEARDEKPNAHHSLLGSRLSAHAIDHLIGRPHRMGEKLVVDDRCLIAVAPNRMPRSGGCVPD